MFSRQKMRFEVVSGDFSDKGNPRFTGRNLMLAKSDDHGLNKFKYSPRDLAKFEVVEGTWGEYWAKWGDWSRAVFAGTKTGAKVAAVQTVTRRFPGSGIIYTWASAVLGANAAKKALESGRKVTVCATFRDGAVLRAKVSERELTRALPKLINHLIEDRDRPAIEQ